MIQSCKAFVFLLFFIFFLFFIFYFLFLCEGGRGFAQIKIVSYGNKKAEKNLGLSRQHIAIKTLFC